jgi:hypothetical protein
MMAGGVGELALELGIGDRRFAGGKEPGLASRERPGKPAGGLS